MVLLFGSWRNSQPSSVGHDFPGTSPARSHVEALRRPTPMKLQIAPSVIPDGIETADEVGSDELLNYSGSLKCVGSDDFTASGRRTGSSNGFYFRPKRGLAGHGAGFPASSL